MNYLRGFRFQTALLVFALVFILGISFTYLHQTFRVVIPITKELESVPGIADVNVEKGSWPGSQIQVNLRFQGDASLPASFPLVYQVLKQRGNYFAIALEDSASPKLKAIYNQIRLAVEEAIITGQFTLLEDRVVQLGREHNFTWELAVDREFVYLRLEQGQNVLQRVIARSFDMESKQVEILEEVGGQWLNG